ncbi:MAG: hypothetical protein QOE66_944, partial [Chloroflexota bacterium]|nr:hypothetical protein [Chloroflexota bacterium]
MARAAGLEPDATTPDGFAALELDPRLLS